MTDAKKYQYLSQTKPFPSCSPGHDLPQRPLFPLRHQPPCKSRRLFFAANPNAKLARRSVQSHPKRSSPFVVL